TLRRVLMGVAMGVTGVAIVYSPWGRHSGAHINPCLTLTFFRLGKVAPADAFFYVLAQFVGGASGVTIAATALGSALADPAVNYVGPLPGDGGLAIAIAAEAAISFILMLLKSLMQQQRKCGVHGHDCHQGLFARNLFLGQRIPLAGVAHQNGTIRFGRNPR